MASVNELDKKIQTLEDEIKNLESEKTALEEEQNPDDVQAAQPKIGELTKQIEDKEKELTHLKKQKAAAEKTAAEKAAAEKAAAEKVAAEKAAVVKATTEKSEKRKAGIAKPDLADRAVGDLPRVGQVYYHWSYGPVKILSVDDHINGQVLDVEGIRAVNWPRDPYYIPQKKWELDAVDKWLHEYRECVANSPIFLPDLMHKSYLT